MMSPMHEEMHADGESKQRDEDSVSSKNMDAVLIGQQQGGDGEKSD